jgi:putative FmdB family regulatory protein
VPWYEFLCSSCGSFEEHRPFAQATEAAYCPACGAPAQRVLTPPYLRRLEAPVRRALEREERSRHEPEVVRRQIPPIGPCRQRVGGRPWTAGP